MCENKKLAKVLLGGRMSHSVASSRTGRALVRVLLNQNVATRRIQPKSFVRKISIFDFVNALCQKRPGKYCMFGCVVLALLHAQRECESFAFFFGAFNYLQHSILFSDVVGRARWWYLGEYAPLWMENNFRSLFDVIVCIAHEEVYALARTCVCALAVHTLSASVRIERIFNQNKYKWKH